MDVLVAFGHIGGAIVVLLVLAAVDSLLIGKWDERRNKRDLEAFLLSQGVAVAEIHAKQFSPQVIRLLSARYSSEQPENRISDSCDVVRFVWELLRLLTVFLVLLAAVWYAFTDTANAAAYAWWSVALWVFFWAAHVSFSLLCKVLTGRYPGQAKRYRKALHELAQMSAE